MSASIPHAAVEAGAWTPGIGDPTAIGWFIVAAYAVAACLAWRAQRALGATTPRERRERWLWRAWFVVLVGMGLNKQLDLQSLLTEVGRALAHDQGWFEQRRRVQRWFVFAVSAQASVAAALLVWWLRSAPRRVWLGCAGAGVLALFVVVRAATFHHVNVGVLHSSLPIHYALELAGIGLLSLAARSVCLGSAQPR